MAVEITAADLDRIIRDMAEAGKPPPQWVKDDPKYLAVYNKAAGIPGPSGPTKTAKPAAARPAPNRTARAGQAAQPHPSPTGPGGGKSGKAGKTGGGRSARAGRRRQRSSRAPRPAGPVPLPRALSRAAGGSAAGGLFLAIFTYPIALALFQHGPDGLGMWLRAKFLNQVTEPAGEGFWSRSADAIKETAKKKAEEEKAAQEQAKKDFADEITRTPPARYDPTFPDFAQSQGVPA